ncbi:MAG: hypothetical protein OXD32_05755 [Endozoicomonadaceae bacterium]|nr:hypothetical protein [Endozoicomonadaceae bacterium]MCY4330547.1 hypothetical protein [Endozoicomonadaceae bacterium]
MSSVGGIQNQPQVQELRHAETTQQAEKLAKTGMGNIGDNTLSVGHQAGTEATTGAKGAATAIIATPQEGALNGLNTMDSANLEATLSGLRSQTDEIQAKFQQEVASQRKDDAKKNSDKMLEQMEARLKAKEKGNKCQNVVKKIMPAILPPLLIVEAIKGDSVFNGNNKQSANEIRNEMMMHKYGPDVGKQMIQFKDDYREAAREERRGIEGEHTAEKKTKLHEQLNGLHQAGALDDATHYELGQMIDNNNMSSININEVLVDHMMGDKQPLLAPESYPDNIQVSVPDSSDSESTAIAEDSSGAVETKQNDNTQWLADMAKMMQQQEEESQALSKVIQDIEDGKSAVIQSNQDSQLQMSMKQQLI